MVKSIANIMKNVSIMMLNLILLMHLLTLELILNSNVYNGKFDCTQNSIATKAIKCAFNGCEVWGFHKAPHVQNFWNESCSVENQQIIYWSVLNLEDVQCIYKGNSEFLNIGVVC